MVFELASSIAEFVNNISHVLKIIDIGKIQLAEEIKFAESININFLIDKNEPNLIISPVKRLESGETESYSLVLSSKNQKEKFPFGSGHHYIINQSSWLKSKNHITINDSLKIIPISENEDIYIDEVDLYGLNRTFRFFTDGCNKNEIEIWQGGDSIQVDFDSAIKINSSKWSFVNHQVTQFINFDCLPNVIFSFDTILVKKVIRITRWKKGWGEQRQIYLLVVGAEH